MQSGLDDTKYTLTEHLGELRGRLIKSFLGVLITTLACGIFAPQILAYSVEPLTTVLKQRLRIQTILVHPKDELGDKLSSRLADNKRVNFHGRQESLQQAAEIVKSVSKSKDPIDLVLVSTAEIKDDTALISDMLEGVEPSPYVVYLVRDPKAEIVSELMLEGALVIKNPPRTAVLKRVLRRAAAAAGKSASGDKLVVLSPLDPFFAYLKIALVCGLFLACPIWLYQAWGFVAPGLYSNEKKVALPVVFSGSLLFIGGGAFAYFLMFPMMFDVLINQMMPESLAGSFTIDKYLGLLMRVTMAFGIVFELPLAMAMAAAVGIVQADQLRKFRRYAIVISFVAAAVLTPADPLSQVMMAVPLVLFYEIGIWLAAILGKKREQALSAQDAQEA